MPDPRPIVERITGARFLTLAGACMLAVWLAAFIAHEATAPGLVDRQGVAIGRDFLGFYTAGELVRRGQGQQLFDPALQLAVQREVLAPDRQLGHYYFINPAFWAVLYAPFASLPYRVAVYLHVLLLGAAFIVGARLLRPRLPRIGGAAATLLALTWPPMIHTVLGGQNAALSFMLLAAAYVASVERRQVLAGLALGAQLFKPQFALPLLGLLLLRGELVTVAAAALTALALYGLGAIFCGARWPLEMLSALSGYYVRAERAANGHKHIALPEAIDYALTPRLPRATWVAPFVHGLGLASVTALYGYLVLRWRRAAVSQPAFACYWALAVSVSLLASLHAHEYESAVLALPALLLVEDAAAHDAAAARRASPPLAAAYLLTPLVMLLRVSRLIRFHPLVLLPIGVAGWAASRIRAARAAEG